MMAVAIEIFLCGLLALALVASIGAFGCFLQMCVYQNADWEHDREVGWASAHLCVQQRRPTSDQQLRIIFAEFSRDKLSRLRCPIHGKEEYKDGERAYYRSQSIRPDLEAALFEGK